MTRKILLSLFGAGAALALVAAPASAQIAWSVGAGISKPNGDFGDAFKTGFHGMLAGDLKLTGAPISIRADGMYSTYSSKASGGDSFNDISVAVDAKYAFAPGPVSPYILGGPDWNHASSGGTSSSKIGFNVGGGINFGMSALKLFVEARYFSVSDNGVKTNWIPVTVGIHF
ncbi:MAG: outer membrane beta-barrel protein [Gemmatimonadetes bacterium]|nr:outer membrane beta-barrel protein [Gemmatimonadota bacterium]